MSTIPACVFCGIVAGSEPASVVYEDERVVAFLDTWPVNPGHVLIIPRRHGAYLQDMDPDDGAAVFKASLRLAAAVRACGVRCDGVNLVLNDGADAGQQVFHSHLHVIPRVRGDALRRDHTTPHPSRAELDEIAAAIRTVLV